MLLGDARTGKLPGNIVAFGRALRRAGVPVDASRISLAQQAIMQTGIQRKDDVEAALEAVMVSRPQDIAIFRELFDAFFRNPEVAQKLLSQMLPQAEGKHTDHKRRPRVREALAPQRTHAGEKKKQQDVPVEFDAAMTASDNQRLRHADFNQLTASEYALVQRLVCSMRLQLPSYLSRRLMNASRGTQLNWSEVSRHSARYGGELLSLPTRKRQSKPAPILILVDVSGSMERYARMLLAYLHAATRGLRGREVFAFGTELTPLNHAFKQADTDAMLAVASKDIADFAGGTKLGDALALIRTQHAKTLIGKRSVVLLITDGLDTGEPQALADELAWLKRKSKALLWLNPLLRFEGYEALAQGAQQLHKHADAMLAVHNITKLEQLAAALSNIIQFKR